MHFTDATCYEGDWKAGKPDGFGKETYPDGSSYTGRFQHDLRQGAGTYTAGDKVEYPGFWRDGGWEKNVESEAQAQLDEAMHLATTACNQAMELEGNLQVLKQLHQSLTPGYRGLLVVWLLLEDIIETLGYRVAVMERADNSLYVGNTVLSSRIPYAH
jgi:hypothetical protein